MPRKFIRRFADAAFGTPWERHLRRARLRGTERVLVVWNRGLGDIALGLSQVIAELRERLPGIELVVLTREDLAECFAMLPVDRVLVDADLRRGSTDAIRQSMRRAGFEPTPRDLVLVELDPTRWFRGTRRKPPVLRWPDDADARVRRFDDRFLVDGDGGAGGPWIDIACHVSSETAAFYRYRKDWPIDCWQAMADDLASRHRVRFVLFGLAGGAALERVPCIDLRGATSILDALALIRHRCPLLVAPDSGLLTMTYYLDGDAPVDVVSLWADPRQGILKHATASPNPSLRHVALIGADEQVENVPVADAVAAVESMIATRRATA